MLQIRRIVYLWMSLLFAFLLSCAVHPQYQVETLPAPPPEKKVEKKEKPDFAEIKRQKIKHLARDILVRLEAINRDIYKLEKITLVVWYPYDDGTKIISPCGKSFYRDLYSYVTSQFDPRYIRIVDREDFEKTLEEMDFQKRVYFDENTVVQIGKKLSANVGLIGRVRKYPKEIEFFPKFLDITTSDVLPCVDPVVVPMDKALEKDCLVRGAEKQVGTKIQPESKIEKGIVHGELVYDFELRRSSWERPWTEGGAEADFSFSKTRIEVSVSESTEVFNHIQLYRHKIRLKENKKYILKLSATVNKDCKISSKFHKFSPGKDVFYQFPRYSIFELSKGPNVKEDEFVSNKSTKSARLTLYFGEVDSETKITIHSLKLFKVPEEQIGRKKTQENALGPVPLKTQKTHGIRLSVSGTGSDILASYFKSEAANRGFIVYEEIDTPTIDPGYQLYMSTNLGNPQSINGYALQCWYIQASVKFTERSTGKNIYLTLRDIQDIDARIYGKSLEQALRGPGPNSFTEKIGEPFIREFFRRLDRFLPTR